jgi:hypothetical protein
MHSRNVGNILLIDWHTAVRPYGNWTFIPIDQDSEIAFKTWAPNVLVGTYDVGIPTGGNLLYSMVKAKSRAKLIARGLSEAGTYPVTEEINAIFILRLYCRFFSNITDLFCQQIIAQTKEFFYPQAEKWKNLTYNVIDDVLPTLLIAFTAWTSGVLTSTIPTSEL